MYSTKEDEKLLIFILLFTHISYNFGQNKITTVENDISVTNVDSIQTVLDNYEQVELPPLSVFWHRPTITPLSGYMRPNVMKKRLH